MAIGGDDCCIDSGARRRCGAGRGATVDGGGRRGRAGLPPHAVQLGDYSNPMPRSMHSWSSLRSSSMTLRMQSLADAAPTPRPRETKEERGNKRRQQQL
jgi:hypothetical protein